MSKNTIFVLTNSIDISLYGLIVVQLFKKYISFYGP
jgi:hypothetical protein